jgi:signal transduction histidine kinase
VPGQALHTGPIVPSQIVRDAIGSAHVEAGEAEINIMVDRLDDTELVADPVRLRQLLDNLLSNAIKFTPAGGEVVVSGHRSGGAWTLKVADTGIGIPRADHDRLLERFFRASNARDQRVLGSGLGLAIVNTIVELHHGGIDIDSEVGEGTTIRVTMPLDQDTAVDSAAVQ